MAGMAGLNIGALPMNPALVAAALNQAGWSLMGNLQQGGGGGPTVPHSPGLCIAMHVVLLELGPNMALI